MSSNVNFVFEKVCSMATQFEFKPAVHINNTVRPKKFGASRTAIRGATSRLGAERLLVSEGGCGLIVPLSPTWFSIYLNGIKHLKPVPFALLWLVQWMQDHIKIITGQATGQSEEPFSKFMTRFTSG